MAEKTYSARKQTPSEKEQRKIASKCKHNFDGEESENEDGRKEGYGEGYEEGYEKGYEEGYEEGCKDAKGEDENESEGEGEEDESECEEDVRGKHPRNEKTGAEISKRLRRNGNLKKPFNFSPGCLTPQSSPLLPPTLPRTSFSMFGSGGSLRQRLLDAEQETSLLPRESRLPKRNSSDSLHSLGNIPGDPNATPASQASYGMSLFDSPGVNMQSAADDFVDENQQLKFSIDMLNKDMEHKKTMFEKEMELQEEKHKNEMLKKDMEIQEARHEVEILKKNMELLEAKK